MITTTRWFPFDLDEFTDNVVFFGFGNQTSSLDRPDPLPGQELIKTLTTLGCLSLGKLFAEGWSKRDDTFLVGYTEDGIYPNVRGKFVDRGCKRFPGPNSVFAKKVAQCDLMISTYRGCLPIYEEYGAKNVAFVPPSCSAGFLIDAVNPVYENDVVFMGNNSDDDPRYEDRFPIVEAVAKHCDKKGYRFDVFGDGWEKLKRGGRGFFRRGLVEAIASSRIVLTLHRVALKIPWWDICFSDSIAKTMASSSTLAICDNMPGHEDYFDEEMVVFNEPSDLCEKIDMFLKDDKERSRLAYSQYRTVKGRFTRTKRASDISECIRNVVPPEFVVGGEA